LQSIANRKGEIVSMSHHATRVSVEAIIPTRGLIGFETDLVNLTRGEGLMSHLFREYAPFKGEIGGRGRGVMVSMESGVSTAYALNNIQERGRLFIGPQEEVYEGMIVGENARPEGLPVNPCKEKHLTNMRSQGEGKGIQLEAPLRMRLERAIEYIELDEYVEVTRRSQIDNLGFDGQDVARSHDIRPAQFINPKTDRAFSEIHILHKQPHGHCCGVPAAGDQAFENCSLGAFTTKMKHLRIKFVGELDKLLLRHI